MNSLDGIIKLADNELMSFVGSGKFRSREDVDTAYKLIDIIKDIYCVWGMEEEDGYSSDGGSYRGGRSYRDGYLPGDRSYRSYDGNGTPQRSYEGGRSRNAYRYSRADYMDEMRRMMETAPDEQTRQDIQRMILQMEQQM